jgi:hypothetical protein
MDEMRVRKRFWSWEGYVSRFSFVNVKAIGIGKW